MLVGVWSALAVPVALGQGDDPATAAAGAAMPAPERDALAKAIRVAEAAQSLRVCMPDWCPGFFDGQLTQLERELTEALAGVEARAVQWGVPQWPPVQSRRLATRWQRRTALARTATRVPQ